MAKRPLVLACVLAAVAAAPAREAWSTEPADADLRERLTAREDQRRSPDPWTTQLAGRPLTLAGELSVSLEVLRRTQLGSMGERDHRLLLVPSLEVEAFYAFESGLSLFAQARLEYEEDLASFAGDGVSDLFAERGEMWVYAEGLLGLPLDLDIGRLDFQDDRRWWWDEELDAARLVWEGESWDLGFALARELLPTRSDRGRVSPEQERVVRMLGEFSWDWTEDHSFEVFALHQRDHSPTERRGRVVRARAEDESDARLTWLGVRATGVLRLSTSSLLGYWLDAGGVRGRERLVGYETLSKRRSRAISLTRRGVRGWAVDGGVSFMHTGAREPRVYAAFALGSGDATPEAGADRSYRQSGIHTNEAGFGGVEHFARYGVLLQPELSNLRIWTLGLGISLLETSSLDLVYHRYRLHRRRSPIRTESLELELSGRSRDVGHGLDLVLALEEWDTVALQVQIGAFRAGRALGSDHRRLSVGGSIELQSGF